MKNLSVVLVYYHAWLLRTALNIHWSQHVTNRDLYADLPRLSSKIRSRRLRFAGHCHRSREEIAAELVLWTPKHGRRKAGRPAATYIDCLRRDTGLEVDYLGQVMEDRECCVSRVKKRVTLPWEEEDDPSPGAMEYMKFSKPMKLSVPRPVSGRGSSGPQTSRVSTPLPPPGETGLDREGETMSDSLDPSQILPIGSMLDHLSASFHDDGRSFRTKTESERQDRSTNKDTFSEQSIPLSDNDSQKLSDDDNDSQKLSDDENEAVEGDVEDQYREKNMKEKQYSDQKDDKNKVVGKPEEEERSDSETRENTEESGSTTEDEEGSVRSEEKGEQKGEDRTDTEPRPQQSSDNKAEGFGTLLGVIREESVGEKSEPPSPPQTTELAGLRMDRSDSRQDSASSEIIFTKGQFLATGIFEPDLEPKVSRVIPSPRPKSAQSGRQSRQSSRSARSGSKPSSASVRGRVMSDFDEDEDLGIFDDNGSSESASKSGESTPGQPVIQVITGQRKRPKSSYGQRLRADLSPDKTASQTPEDSRPESPKHVSKEQSDQESDSESSTTEKPETDSPKLVGKKKPVDQSTERRTQGGRPIPMYGAPPEYDQLKQAVKRQQETKAAVDIQRIFRGYRVRNYYRHFLHKLDETDKREAALHIQRAYRQHRARLRTIEAQPGKLREETEHFARQYEEDSQNKMWEKQKRWEKDKQQLLEENREAAAMIARIGPHVEMYEAFHPKRTGPTKAEVKKAAICIQRHIRGWLVRKRYHRLQDKAKKHADSFTTCVKMYRQMLNRIMTRHGVNRPTIPLIYSQLEEFLDRKNKYEKMFNKRQFWNEIEVSELPSYFKDCEHHPSEREIHEAWDIVTKGTPANVGHALKKKEVVEVAFQIYVPSGTGLTQQETRRSTWLNPIVNGLEGNKYMGSEQVEETDYKTCAALVQKSYRERKKRETAEAKQKTNGEPPESTNGSSAGSEQTNQSKGEKKVTIVEPSVEDEDSVTSEDLDEDIPSDNGVLDS
ncbi:uncharacterized protein LOC144917855 [Branchiostoma floridae x Branchiostoma belcheri]